MTHRLFHLVTGLVFAGVSLLHLARLAYEAPVVVAGAWSLPMWFSWAGLIFAAALSFWAIHIWDTERRATRKT